MIALRHLVIVIILFHYVQTAFVVETFNILHGAGMDKKINITRTAATINQVKPHLCGCQEVDHKTLRNPYDQTQKLADLTGMNGVFGKVDRLVGGDYGNAILSRNQILEVKKVVFKTKAHPTGEKRGAIAVRVQIDYENIWFATTHLDFRVNDGQLKQCEELIAFTKNLTTGKLVVVGDFNSVPDSKVVALMKKHYKDVWEVCGSGPGYTFPSDKPTKRIDYIFVSDSVKVESCKVVCNPSSDHCTLVAVVS